MDPLDQHDMSEQHGAEDYGFGNPEPVLDYKGNELSPVSEYMQYGDEIFDTDDVWEFLEHIGAEPYDED